MDTKLIRTILFNILVVTSLLFIYFMFFPKKSYVDNKLNNVVKKDTEEIFNQNMKNMEIAATRYFEENEKDEVTLEELINNNLLVDLKDGDGNSCDTTKTYAKKEENKTSIYLSCTDKADKIVLNDEKTNVKEPEKICIYQYEKKEPTGYTDWTEWSNWQTEEIKESELMEVETKIETEVQGTKTEEYTKEISIDANKNAKIVCPSGYQESNSKCIKKQYLNTITASISYTCPSGYKRNATTCYKSEKTKEATKKYYCPTNQENIEYVLDGSNCKVYSIYTKQALNNEIYYTCPNNYKLKGNKCYKTQYYEEEVEDYKEVTYYRYRTRNKLEEKNIIKWSKVNDNKLIEEEYNMTEEIFCGF